MPYCGFCSGWVPCGLLRSKIWGARASGLATLLQRRVEAVSQVRVSPSLVAHHRRYRGAPGLRMVRLVVLHGAALLRNILDALSSRGLHAVHVRTPGAHVQRLTLILVARIANLAHSCCGIRLYYLTGGCCSA